MKKKLLPLLAFAIVVSAALLPISVVAASYNPGYTCYYRDIAGSCLSYQVQNPHFFNNYSVGGTTRSVYGNRQTYPFRAMFNAQSTTQNTWDNRTNNKKNFQRVFQYEEDDDDNDYLDDDDEAYEFYYGDDDDEDKGNWPADRSLGGGWRWYFDEDDDTYNRYRYQNDDYYEDDDDNDYYDEDEDRYWDDNDKDFYEEYERTRYYNSNYIRY